jgi:hypothetical protein
MKESIQDKAQEGINQDVLNFDHLSNDVRTKQVRSKPDKSGNRTEQNRTGQDRRTSRKIPGLGNNEKDNINISVTHHISINQCNSI